MTLRYSPPIPLRISQLLILTIFQTKALIDDAQEALTTAASACTSANRKAVRPLKRQKNLDARNDYDVNTTVTARNAAVEVAARKSGIVDELIALVHGQYSS